jgi:endonuclease/exonuclease/phosphatase family metal-dependent hydrolase
MMKLNKILLLVIIGFIALGGCSNSEPDYSKFYQEPGSTQEKPDEPDSPGLADSKIKIMSFNIRYYNSDDTEDKAWNVRKAAFVPMVEEQKPTIIGTQEIRKTQFNWLKNNWTDYAYIDGNSTKIVETSGAPHNVNEVFYLKSILEIVNKGFFCLSDTPDKVGVGWSGSPRVAEWVIFRIKAIGKKIFFLNTHLSLKTDGDYDCRSKEIALIKQKVEEFNTDNLPVAITGDMNAKLEDGLFETWLTFLSDSRKNAVVSDDIASYTGFGKSAQYPDHIFVSGFNIECFSTINKVYNGVTYISDHYPIMATLSFE